MGHAFPGVVLYININVKILHTYKYIVSFSIRLLKFSIKFEKVCNRCKILFTTPSYKNFLSQSIEKIICIEKHEKRHNLTVR